MFILINIASRRPIISELSPTIILAMILEILSKSNFKISLPVVPRRLNLMTETGLDSKYRASSVIKKFYGELGLLIYADLAMMTCKQLVISNIGLDGKILVYLETRMVVDTFGFG